MVVASLFIQRDANKFMKLLIYFRNCEVPPTKARPVVRE